MKKAILLVLFGTANKEAIKNCVIPMENEIRKEFNDEYLILKAFTSKNLINILKRKENISVPRIDEALFYLSSELYEEVIIQPLHFMVGKDQESIKEAIKNYSSAFKRLKIGNPLLGFEGKELEEACDILIDAIKSEIPKDRNVVLVGHGSKTKSNESYYKLEEQFKKLGYNRLLIGTIEGERNIDIIIKELKEKKIKEILLISILILNGNHAKKDVEKGKNSWVERLKNEGIDVEIKMKSLFEYEEIRNIYVERIKNIILK